MDNEQYLDNMSDTVGFLIARMDKDAERAMAIVGEDPRKIGELLIGMTDLAVSMASVATVMVGGNPRELVRMMAMSIKRDGPEIMRRYA